MSRKPGIYCIEGVWKEKTREVEPTVEPLLEMLHRQDLWDYERRDCATTGELKYYLKNEWKLSKYKRGSILYIATHGRRGLIELDQRMELNELEGILKGKCEGRLVHFGGCNVIGSDDNLASKDRAISFLTKTKATAVSGFGANVGWSDGLWRPAVAAELLLFSSIGMKEMNFMDGRSYGKGLTQIQNSICRRFEDCKFNLYTRCGLGIDD